MRGGTPPPPPNAGAGSPRTPSLWRLPSPAAHGPPPAGLQMAHTTGNGCNQQQAGCVCNPQPAPSKRAVQATAQPQNSDRRGGVPTKWAHLAAACILSHPHQPIAALAVSKTRAHHAAARRAAVCTRGGPARQHLAAAAHWPLPHTWPGCRPAQGKHRSTAGSPRQLLQAAIPVAIGHDVRWAAAADAPGPPALLLPWAPRGAGSAAGAAAPHHLPVPRHAGGCRAAAERGSEAGGQGGGSSGGAAAAAAADGAAAGGVRRRLV